MLVTQHQLQLFHAIKLSAIPKDDLKSRIIIMCGIHSKLVFSIFASSQLKKTVEKSVSDIDINAELHRIERERGVHDTHVPTDHYPEHVPTNHYPESRL